MGNIGVNVDRQDDLKLEISRKELNKAVDEIIRNQSVILAEIKKLASIEEGHKKTDEAILVLLSKQYDIPVQDTKEAIDFLQDRGFSVTAIAKLLNVSRQTIYNKKRL